MTELLTAPPPPEAIAAMAAMPSVRLSPGILAVQQGRDGHVGPEGAGAILMLQATFAGEDGARGFWAAAVPLMQMLADAPGFIRRYSFADGPSITLIALWRTVEDAKAFAASPAHRAATRDLYKHRWQYSHFAGLWEMTSTQGRLIFCDRCEGITPATEQNCRTCGGPLVDVYRADE